MAITFTQLTPTFAFTGYAGMRASSQHLEIWQCVTTGGTTSGTLTTARITAPRSNLVFITDDGSVVAVTPTITPLASGKATLAYTGLTSGKTYIIMVRGTV